MTEMSKPLEGASIIWNLSLIHIYPLVLVGAVIGVITALLVAAYAAVKDKKTAMGFERNMEDGEIIDVYKRQAPNRIWKSILPSAAWS